MPRNAASKAMWVGKAAVLKMRSTTLLMATMMLCLLLTAGAALADTAIDTTPQWDGQQSISPFGHPDTATYGQVITAPTDDTVLDSFTFMMDLPSTVTFRGEVYAWDGEKATGPSLYESAPRTTSGSGFEEVTFDTGGVELVAGQQYILFATISKDYEVSKDTGLWGVVSDDTYLPGTFVFMNSGPNFDLLFEDAWYQNFGLDLAFKAVFVSLTPAPPECTIKGTRGDDVLIGTARRDVICGYGGNDTIRGMGGNDLIMGGAGSDTIQGNAGDDTIYGGDGKDTIQGNGGNDTIYGGSNNDTMQGNDGRDKLYGGSGDDTMQGGAGDDLLKGGTGQDTTQQ